jgi:peptide/nickel transport system ATP-binding protein
VSLAAGGEVTLMGRDLLALSEKEMEAVGWKDIAMVFQGAMNALNPVRTVGEQIAEAVLRHAPGTPRAALEARVCELLELVRISAARWRQYPHPYSGGQRQRVVIAGAWSWSRPRCWPTSRCRCWMYLSGPRSSTC